MQGTWRKCSGADERLGVEEGEPFSPQGKLLQKTFSVPIVLSCCLWYNEKNRTYYRCFAKYGGMYHGF